MSDVQDATIIPVQSLELSYASLAGDEVPPATRENAHLLQHAADYQVCVRNLRRSGIGDIIWGVICCGIGYASLRFAPVNIGLVALGVGLLAIGTWLVITPSPIGTIIDGVMLLLVAAWNLGICAWIMYRTGIPEVIWIVIAISQVAWGIRRIKVYPRFATAVAMRPSAAAITWLRDLAKATLKAKPSKDAAIVQFTRRGWISYEKWKGRLLPEVGVFVMNSGSFGGNRDVLLASQDEVEILSQKKMLMAKRYKLEMRIRERNMKVRMPQDSLQKLQSWLAPVEMAATVVLAPV